MQWFKHDTDASTDSKVRKLIMKHGATGYAIYFHCLELIVGDISESNITFELEHDSEIIADNLKIKGTSDESGIAIVERIMMDIVELGLFNRIGNSIFCHKLLSRLDTSMTSNSKLRNMITSAKKHHDEIMTLSCKNRIEENRIDKNIYGELKNVALTNSEYDTLISDYSLPVVKAYIDKLSCYIPNKKGAPYRDHAAAIRQFMKRDNVQKVKIHETLHYHVDKHCPYCYRIEGKLTKLPKNLTDNHACICGANGKDIREVIMNKKGGA